MRWFDDKARHQYVLLDRKGEVREFITYRAFKLEGHKLPRRLREVLANAPTYDESKRVPR